MHPDLPEYTMYNAWYHYRGRVKVKVYGGSIELPAEPFPTSAGYSEADMISAGSYAPQVHWYEMGSPKPFRLTYDQVDHLRDGTIVVRATPYRHENRESQFNVVWFVPIAAASD